MALGFRLHHCKILAAVVLFFPAMMLGLTVLGILWVSFAVVANPIFLGVIWGDFRPKTPPTTELASVSGFYGPGAYWAWVLCTISAIVGSIKGKDTSPMLSSDQVASFIYSASSMYWYHARVVWYRLDGPNLLQDPSVQAASLVLNVSLLLHGFGALFSAKRKRIPWLVILVWDAWFLLLSPIMSVGLFPIIAHCGIFPLVCGIVFQNVDKIHHPLKIAPLPLMLFILFEAVKANNLGIHYIVFTPRTTSHLTDMDQLVSLVTVIGVTLYQWELWNVPRVVRLLRTHLRRNPFKVNSVYLERREGLIT
jgi:hypothetical protein